MNFALNMAKWFCFFLCLVISTIAFLLFVVYTNDFFQNNYHPYSILFSLVWFLCAFVHLKSALNLLDINHNAVTLKINDIDDFNEFCLTNNKVVYLENPSEKIQIIDKNNNELEK